MNLPLIIYTVRFLKIEQVYHQIKKRLFNPDYIIISAPAQRAVNLRTKPIHKYISCDGETFTFLNLAHRFAGWNFTDNGMLWAYNQNYFDWINQEGFSVEDGCKWIDKFIMELPDNKVGLDPYPIALRSINWVKFFCKYPQAASKEHLDSLYSQIKLLEKKLEFHLLGNHLLEDAYALYIVASYFGDDKLLKKARKLLMGQLKEQILSDGAHYEQSPMYHCILLDRLLDCINIKSDSALIDYAQKMLGHLESVTWGVGSLPLLNDSANGIAPTTSQLFYYAKALGLKWKKLPMKECGYRKLMAGNMEAIVDVGNITATYQPGHTHADTFNYELRIDGRPFVVDTGISTYNKTERRQLERSTVAHNCVSPNGKNSSEVWGGFRVGKRCYVFGLQLTDYGLEACHDGFGKSCKRRFEMNSNGFTVEDWYDDEATSYIHLAEDADENRINIEGALRKETKPWQYSTAYNQFHEGKVVEISFKGQLRYTIR